ncbi:uncharacterized protein cubi_02506 [Cryptosporidium ubiquitum]|uniref:Transmembrane protein n=1 Tax=Cryptosporidium ubiquitum TaxID=857276 RepID=A0A1J4MG92_9CRYT|nr:uncharacterized protein cubi_02506 [Cryptosporidium ubiquitum]OII73274.1 hypothetical protein cubi_02506 [Cryptosporidium ubiquitum]
MSYNIDWSREESIDNIGCSYENLNYEHRSNTASNHGKSRENSMNVNTILFEDHFSPRLSEGLNSMRFSELGDMTEEEWNKQQQRQNSQRYDALYIVSEREEDIIKMKNPRDKLKFKVIGNEGTKVNDSISDTTLGYICSLIYNFRENNTIRSKQSQLTLWEIMKQFYLVNNLFFILKVLKTLASSNRTHRLSQDMGWVSFMCLLSTFLTSILAYLTRSFIFYHRIDDKYTKKLFSPFHVYSQIRRLGEEMPEALFMLERVNWTYTLIMHILEDIPQLFASSIFLSYYGNDFYAFFMITWSSCMIITTSIRMGISYPLIGTLSLIFSRKPPVDSPTLNEATTTTLHFPLFMAAITFIWAVADSLCLYFTHGFWTILFYFGLTANILASTLFILYYVHLSKQASAYARQLNSLYFTEDYSRIQSRHF